MRHGSPNLYGFHTELLLNCLPSRPLLTLELGKKFLDFYDNFSICIFLQLSRVAPFLHKWVPDALLVKYLLISEAFAYVAIQTVIAPAPARLGGRQLRLSFGQCFHQRRIFVRYLRFQNGISSFYSNAP